MKVVLAIVGSLLIISLMGYLVGLLVTTRALNDNVEM